MMSLVTTVIVGQGAFRIRPLISGQRPVAINDEEGSDESVFTVQCCGCENLFDNRRKTIFKTYRIPQNSVI